MIHVGNEPIHKKSECAKRNEIDFSGHQTQDKAKIKLPLDTVNILNMHFCTCTQLTTFIFEYNLTETHQNIQT